MKDKTWVLVANNVKARILESDKGHALTEVHALIHPEGRLHEGDLVSDGSGKARDKTGGAMEPKTAAKVVEAEGFAKYLATHLYEAHTEGKFERLYIVASPQVLGHLRDNLKGPTKQLVAGEVNKDLTAQKPDQIRDHLPYVL